MSTDSNRACRGVMKAAIMLVAVGDTLVAVRQNAEVASALCHLVLCFRMGGVWLGGSAEGQLPLPL